MLPPELKCSLPSFTTPMKLLMKSRLLHAMLCALAAMFGLAALPSPTAAYEQEGEFEGEYGDDDRNIHRCLIDCGTQQTSKELLRRVAALPAREQFFELFILSHIDSDHIGGALPLFKQVNRMNAYNTYLLMEGQAGK